jgi:hypothetical protein
MKEFLDNLKKSLPKYNTIQPSTKKKISFRPFTVKEEKALLISNNTGTYADFLTTLGNVIDECFSLKIEATNLPVFDIEYFFIKLRCKSIGELIEPIIVCPETGEKIQLSLNLEEIEPVFAENSSNEIDLDSCIVKLRYPTLQDLIDKKENEDYYDMMLKCIETIQTPKELIEVKNASKKELEDFIDLLTKQQFNKLVNFFKNMPKIEKTISYKTSDGIERKIVLRGIRDFFQSASATPR